MLVDLVRAVVKQKAQKFRCIFGIITGSSRGTPPVNTLKCREIKYKKLNICGDKSEFFGKTSAKYLCTQYQIWVCITL